MIHLALLTVALLFSANYIISKVAMHSFAPLSFAWLRVAGSALVLNAIAPGRGFSRRDSLLIAGIAVLGVFLNQSLFLAGLALTSAHIAAILITMIPVFTLIVAISIGLERATAVKIGGIALAFAGAILVIGGEGVAGITDSLAGSLLIVGNCLSYALYLVLSKPLMERLSPVRVISRMFALGAVMLFPVSLPSLMREQWHAIPRAAWISLGLVIAGPTVAAYLINAWTLRHAESTLVALYSYVQPVLTAILASVFLHEQIRGIVIVAALLIFAGVALAGRGAAPVPE